MNKKENTSNWEKYYKDTAGKKANPLLQKAVPFVSTKGTALDLGAGILQDTKYLLEEGFEKVIAVDIESGLEDRVKELKDERVEYYASAFDEFLYPKDSYDLVTSQWSLPLSPPDTFESMFARIKDSLKKGGIFTGQFFGTNDEWNTPENAQKMTFLSKSQVEKLLGDMEVISLNEQEKDGTIASGKEKHWHVFYVIARK